MVTHTLETFGRLDYAVNNAGIEGRFTSVVELSEEEWDRVLDINLKGTFLCLKYEARAMLAAGHGGAIVNVGSINSFLGFPYGAAYVSSKHGLIGLTTSVSAELAPHGIRVNIVCPGIIDTPMHQRARKLLGDEVYDTCCSNASIPGELGNQKRSPNRLPSFAQMRRVTSRAVL
jgi:NAD(P)-dependent dehydrogenase (short-subunit alcohol dehydrogenase family)